MNRFKALEPRWLLITAFFIAGVFLGGVGLYLWLNQDYSNIVKIHPQKSQFQYINPLLAVDTYQNRLTSLDKSLEIEIQSLIDNKKRDLSISSAAIYFRDIEPGVWLGINEANKFSPGKLLKIPIMITYYKLAENDPELLNEEITFKGDDSPSHYILKTPELLKAGEKYTIGALIEKMIIDSSDQAANMLFDRVDRKNLNEIFSDLGIDFKEDKETQDFISLKLYSLFFRVLYNASYLNRDYSQKALKLLVKADSSVGLGANLPKSVPIANRVGARAYDTNGSRKYEIYDCGIIYYPEHPYLLCSSAQGKSIEGVKDFLKSLGEIIYTEINYKYK